MSNAASIKSMLNEPPKVIFPCDYPIKIIGENHSDFKSQVTTAGKFTSKVSKPSSISLTISIDLSFRLIFRI